MHNTPMICANCGTERSGSFCGHCGQNDRNYQRALPPLLGDLLRETFEIDSRLLRTLGSLLSRPGELAVEFSHNRRASYVSPIRLYLFVSIVFFFLLSLSTDFDPIVVEPQTQTEEVEEIVATDTAPFLRALGEEQRQKAEEILARPEMSIARMVILQLAKGVQEDTDGLETLDVYLIGQLVDAVYEPGSAVDQLMDNLPIAIFIMLPVYALLLKLFYFGKHRYYVENLVFATHLHTFAFLIFTVELLLPANVAVAWLEWAIELTSTALLLWLAVYHFLALRRYFEDGALITLFKFFVLLTFYFLLLMPAAFTVVLLFTVITV